MASMDYKIKLAYTLNIKVVRFCCKTAEVFSKIPGFQPCEINGGCHACFKYFDTNLTWNDKKIPHYRSLTKSDDMWFYLLFHV